jgi:hypothetical protein
MHKRGVWFAFAARAARVRLAERRLRKTGGKRLHAVWRGLFSDSLRGKKPPPVWWLHPDHTLFNRATI